MHNNKLHHTSNLRRVLCCASFCCETSGSKVMQLGSIPQVCKSKCGCSNLCNRLPNLHQSMYSPESLYIHRRHYCGLVMCFLGLSGARVKRYRCLFESRSPHNFANTHRTLSIALFSSNVADSLYTQCRRLCGLCDVLLISFRRAQELEQCFTNLQHVITLPTFIASI